MADLPELGCAAVAVHATSLRRRYAGAMGCFDAGRGCPFSCSFCTIINVQGRKSRLRTADDIEHIIRKNYRQGIKSFFISDDDFARNRNWEAILDRIIQLRGKEKLKVHFTLQVDTLCHKIPNFVEKAALAGCKKVFIGLENINPESLKGASKGQNRITEYRAMLKRGIAPKSLPMPAIYWVSERYARIDCAGHRNHSARTTDRSPRVFHTHAAARLQGSSGSASTGRADVLRSQQV